MQDGEMKFGHGTQPGPRYLYPDEVSSPASASDFSSIECNENNKELTSFKIKDHAC